MLFIDRVSSALLSAFYFTGSICHGGLATGLIILSDVLFIMNEIGKEEGKEVQKNIDLCSKTCSPKAPNPSVSALDPSEVPLKCINIMFILVMCRCRLY